MVFYILNNMKEIYKQAKQNQAENLRIRRALHQNAEVGFQLPKTCAIVKEELLKMGIQPKQCGKAGWLAEIVGRENGRVVLLRADMDGLPMYEMTGKTYACKQGNMHACGHDMHTTMLLGAARLLKAREKTLQGRVKLLFQPAEEILQGAEDVIKNGALSNPAPDAAFALHVSTGVELPTGTLVLSSREVAAPAADYFKITFQGKSCHGATPHLGTDALLAAAQTVVALSSLPAREQAVDDPFVLTVGKASAGSAGNALAQKAELEGTLRAYTETTRARIKKRLKQIALSQAKSVGARVNVSFTGGCPTLKNDIKLAELVAKCGQELFGQESVLWTDGRGGGSEDFAYFSQRIPAVMIGICANVAQGKETSYPLHHPKVCFQESVLPLGAALLAATAYKWSVENAGMKKSK